MKEKKIGKKISIALLLLTVIIAGVTIAYLQSKGNLTNQFDVGKVSAKIEENFDGQVKSNVRVTNTGNMPVYVRCIFLFTMKHRRGKNSRNKNR